MVVFICICLNLALRTGLQDVLSHANDVPNLQNYFSESDAKTTQTMYISDPNSLSVNSPFGLFTSALAIRVSDLWCVMKALRWGVGSEHIQTASSQSECEKLTGRPLRGRWGKGSGQCPNGLCFLFPYWKHRIRLKLPAGCTYMCVCVDWVCEPCEYSLI